nr:MAG TPA: hypothetical protein [Caudoviricetes sp.]
MTSHERLRRHRRAQEMRAIGVQERKSAAAGGWLLLLVLLLVVAWVDR